MRRTFLAALILLPVLSARADQAGTHLEPYDPLPNWDVSEIRNTVYANALTGDVRAWLYTESAFPSSSGITALKKIAGGYRVVHQELDTMLVLYTKGAMRSGPPPEPGDYRALKPSRCFFEISDDLGGRIVDAWVKVLRKTRDDGERREGSDGGYLTYFARDGGQDLTGRMWSPEDDTEPGMLAVMVNALDEVCTTHIRSRLGEAEKILVRLERHLREEKTG